MDRVGRWGVIMQLTAGSVTGQFGRRVRHYADKMIDEGLVHILATDAHNLTGRPPNLSKARDIVAARLGEAEGIHMTTTRPQVILDNLSPDRMPASAAAREPAKSEASKGFLARLGFGRRGRN